LIEASAGPEDARQKSRWSQALKYVYGWRQPAKKLKWFLQMNGGIAGSAAKLAVRDGTTRREKSADKSTLGQLSGINLQPKMDSPRWTVEAKR
jgi:hypothetical protein